MHGFQLWANLPSSLKMTAPRYQDIKVVPILEVVDDDGHEGPRCRGKSFGARKARLLHRCRSALYRHFGARGTAQKIKGRHEWHAFAYIFEGDGRFASDRNHAAFSPREQVDGEELLMREPVGDRSLVLFDSGDEIRAQAATRQSASCWSPANRSRSRWLSRT